MEPTLQAKLYSFLQVFLRESAKYFSKPLQEFIFLQRLAHEWHTDLVDVLADKQVASAIWIPAQILFYPTRYEIHWSLRGVDYVPEPTIPPGFLERGGEIVSDELLEEGTSMAASNELPGQAEEGGALDAEAIPLSSRFTNPERLQRAQERKRIRQARLRVALAQLKAERLAERYYRKYGDFEEIDDSDSELSEEEDSATLLRDALADKGESE